MCEMSNIKKRITITIYDDTSFSKALYYALQAELSREKESSKHILVKFKNDKCCFIETTKTGNITVKIYK